MDINDLRSLVTVLAFVSFLGITVWALSGARRARFDAAARLPFDEETEAGTGDNERNAG